MGEKKHEIAETNATVAGTAPPAGFSPVTGASIDPVLLVGGLVLLSMLYLLVLYVKELRSVCRKLRAYFNQDVRTVGRTRPGIRQLE